MASSRHKHAVPKRAGLRGPTPRGAAPRTAPSHRGSHKQEAVKASPWHRSATKLVLPAIGVLALVGTSAAVVAQERTPAPAAASVSAAVDEKDIIASALEKDTTVTRDAERPEIPVEATSLDVKGVELALVDGVKVRADAASDSPVLATLDQGDQVDVTGKEKGEWAQVVHKGLPRWVRADEIATELPLGTEPCPVLPDESGLQPDTVKVLRAVCEKFPQIKSIGGIAGRGEHATGRALDIMLGPDIGYDVAAFLQENRAELGIEYLIYRQRIWRPATSGAWRGMSDRGSATANHMDHVHVTTYGTAATG